MNGRSLEFVPDEWVKKAEEDLLTAGSVVHDRDGAPSSVCFLSQQAAEKTLKGFLVFHRNEYPKIRSLNALLEKSLKFDASLSVLAEDARYLNEFYAPTRYPGDYPQFSWKDAEQAFAAAERIKELVLKKIHAQR